MSERHPRWVLTHNQIDNTIYAKRVPRAMRKALSPISCSTKDVEKTASKLGCTVEWIENPQYRDASLFDE